MANSSITLFDRLMAKVEIQPNGCWWLPLAVRPDGYVRIHHSSNRLTYAHLVFFRNAHGEIPPNHEVDHICHDPTTCAGGFTCLHRRCVNPDHLEAVSKSRNHSVARSHTGAALRMLKNSITHCPQGHEYTTENTSMYEGKRGCRNCQRNKSAAARARKLINT